MAGAFGFSDTDTDVTAKLSTEPGSFFTDFGGTSAAASIVAGVAALIQRANKKRNGGKRLDGLAVRKLIKETALRKDAALPHLPGVKLAAGIVDGKLAADNVDGRDLGFEESFGAGLVAAGIAVKAIADGWKP